MAADTVKIVSWNINSVRFRIEIVERFLAEVAPDILCLQETKVEDGLFPHPIFHKLGYVHRAIKGQRMHHGVAILSRLPLGEHGSHDWQDNGEARHVGVRLPGGVRLENVYVPAGGDVPDPALNPKFAQKLAFVERMTRWSQDLREPTLIVGDFNIAPLESDVWSHRQLLDVVSHTPVEVAALGRLQAAHGWVDLGRHFVPAPERLFTWWSYRAKDWAASDRGRRLDHMWASPEVAKTAIGHRVFEDCRSWLKPSDHIPILTEFGVVNVPESDHRSVAQAIDAARRGWPLTIAGRAGHSTLLAIEAADAARLEAFAPDGVWDVLLSPERAATLKLGNQRPAADHGAVRIARAPWLDLDTATALADPARDLSDPFKGPFRAIDAGVADAAGAAIKLARLAGLLPAFFVRDGAADGAPAPGAAAVAGYDSPRRLAIASRARLPVSAAETCEIVAFRSADEAVEHVALILGTPDGHPPLVRLHSECLTGDVFGSLKCDCGPQLDAALARIAAEGWGVLLYLRQEGRGIGLINKLRAYALQDQGFDTVDANLRLGFAIDERDFGVAARMLDLVGQRRIRLLTNNPAKVAGLRDAGIEVIERVPHAIPANPHNAGYLDTKRDRTGHAL